MADVSDWLGEIIEHEILASWDRARETVASARRRSASSDPDLLANLIIGDKARVAAFVGVGTGALQFIPVVGQAVAIGSVLPEAIYLAKVQIDLTLILALLYDHELGQDDAKGIVISCLALALGADFVKRELNLAAIAISRRLLERAIERMGEQELLRLLQRIGIHATRRGILSKVPVIAVPLSSAMNYGQIKAFGWSAKKLLSPSFRLCGSCGEGTGRANRFCPRCGAPMAEAAE
jgi:hypothetical protein